ncbi:hypothetical protein AAMO2058_000282700 [Amorphochlora amoebiformis]
MPKSISLNKSTHERKILSDPDKYSVWIDFKKSMGKEVLDEIEEAYSMVESYYRGLAIMHHKKEGTLEAHRKKQLAQLIQWRLDNIKPRDHLQLIWKRLGFLWDVNELENQLFDLERPIASYTKKQGKVLWEVPKGLNLVDFLNIFRLVMQNKKTEMRSLEKCFQVLGKKEKGMISAKELTNGLAKNNFKFSDGRTIDRDQISMLNKLAGGDSKGKKGPGSVKCQILVKKMMDGMDPGGKKKRKKRKKKKR